MARKLFKKSEPTTQSKKAYYDSIVDTIADIFLQNTDKKLKKWPRRYHEVIEQVAKEFVNKHTRDLNVEHEKLHSDVWEAYDSPIKKLARMHKDFREIKNAKKTPERIEYEKDFNRQLQRLVPNYSKEDNLRTLRLTEAPEVMRTRKLLEHK